MDFSGFIQDKSIQQVEMEDVSEEVEVVKEKSKQEGDDEDEEAVSFKKLEQVFTVKLPSRSAAEIDSDDEPCFGF